MDDYLNNWAKFNAKLWDMDEYRLTMEELKLLCRDFQNDCFDGFVSNDEGYIEMWLDKHGVDPI